MKLNLFATEKIASRVNSLNKKEIQNAILLDGRAG